MICKFSVNDQQDDLMMNIFQQYFSEFLVL